MLKDIRLHGSVTPEVDFYATLAGEKLISSHFYEFTEGEKGPEIQFFLMGHHLKLTTEGIRFSGSGGIVSEYMFGSPMPLEDLGHKEVRNRLEWKRKCSLDLLKDLSDHALPEDWGLS